MPKELTKDHVEKEEPRAEHVPDGKGGSPSYYYDDAHGYEEYDPDRDVEADDEFDD